MKKEQKQEDMSPKERELESQALEDTTNSGSITIDNVDILDLSENALRDNIAVITQAPYIFNAMIRNNMLFVKKMPPMMKFGKY